MKNFIKQIEDIVMSIPKIGQYEKLSSVAKDKVIKVASILIKKNKIHYADVKAFHKFLSRREIFGEKYPPEIFRLSSLYPLMKCVNKENLERFVVIFDGVLGEYKKLAEFCKDAKKEEEKKEKEG